MPILRVAREHAFVAPAMAAQRGRRNRFVRFWASVEASGGEKFSRMGYSLPRIAMNHRAKFDAVSFILGGKIRNRKNTQTNKQTNKKQQTIYPTLCLSACVDNKWYITQIT